MCQTKKKCARKGRGCAKRKKNVPGRVEEGPKWKKWTFLRLGREEEGEIGIFGDYKQTELTQTDGNPISHIKHG